MCAKNNTIIYVARASNSKRDCEHDLYCCLCRGAKHCAHAARDFRSHHQDGHCSDELLLNNFDETTTFNQINITSPTQVCTAIQLNNSLIDNHLYSWRGVNASDVRPKAHDFGERIHL